MWGAKQRSFVCCWFVMITVVVYKTTLPAIGLAIDMPPLTTSEKYL